MNEQEALRILHPTTSFEALLEIEYYGGFNGKEAKLSAVEEACLMAVKALEKQIPKKAIGKYTDFKCSVCGRRVRSGKGSSSRQRDNFCQRCGQAIDWSEEE